MADLPHAFLSLDVEDWDHANFEQLRSHEARIAKSVKEHAYSMDRNVEAWITLCARYQVRTTCFVLGEFARRFPHAVRRLDQAGHEIASHGDTHQLVREMSPEQFAEFLKRGLGAVGDLTGRSPRGFRAPSWSVPPLPKGNWVYRELAQQGIVYDSSVFPLRTGLFGDPNASLRPETIESVVRLPVGVLGVGSVRLPFSTGAFFRLTPRKLIHWGLRRVASSGQIAQVVLHPREFDAAHPRLPLRGFERWIHYARLRGTASKLETLLPEFQWATLLDAASAYRQN